MIPAAFGYHRAVSVDDAVSRLVQEGEGARPLAGGHSLLPFMKLRFAHPALLVDLGELTELSYVRLDGDQIRVGALTTHRDVAESAVARQHLPLLAEVAAHIGDPQVRSRGTIGGSVAHADPAAEYPALCLALGATFVTTRRAIPAQDFFQGRYETALDADELLLEVVLPAGTGPHAYLKFGKQLFDWAIAGVMVQRQEDGWRIGLVNLAETPVRAVTVERALAEGASLAEAAALASDGLSPTAGPRASAEYLLHLSRVLTERALSTAGS